MEQKDIHKIIIAIKPLVRNKSKIEARKLSKELKLDRLQVDIQLRKLFNSGHMPGYSLLHSENSTDIMYYYKGESNTDKVEVNWLEIVKAGLMFWRR